MSLLPGPSARSPAGPLRGALEIPGRAALPRSLQGECRTLRVRTLDDPASACCLKGSFKHLPAASGDALCGRVDVVGVEITEPERSGDRRRLGEHAADHLPSC